MQKELNKLAEAVHRKRKEEKLSTYTASIMCGMGSNSGLKSMENGCDCKVITLLRLSKGLKINISIINGVIYINN